MFILIEEYPYPTAVVGDLLKNIEPLQHEGGTMTAHCVGYYYDAALKDCVFILPKVLLHSNGLVFGKYEPRKIIDFNASHTFKPEEEEFLYMFSVWIYRAIVVFKNNAQNDTSIVCEKKIAEAGRGARRQGGMFLDIILALLEFHRQNRNFLFFALKNQHSGLNKINWTRTIARTPAVVQGGLAVYLNPVNKRRCINFDEELLVIFYSILNYIGEAIGFKSHLDCNIPLLRGKQFDRYLAGYGKVRLRQIKYKYFSDKALLLWQLCYAFFDKSKQIAAGVLRNEQLLVKSFHVVFEAIIDALISDSPLPDGMQRQQPDGKILDHLFTAKSLFENSSANTYYIGDSKYYMQGHKVGEESRYKQFTYARNVIQWNVDIFNGGKKSESGIKLRDDLTEGYNVVPNFFISARMNEKFRYDVDGIQQREKNAWEVNSHFPNRLFDRDTLLLAHYDVNFLFVLALYARDNKAGQTEWKKKIQEKFREETQKMLDTNYKFYVMKPHDDVDAKKYIDMHFREIIGKVYSPDEGKTLFLALENGVDDKGVYDTLCSDFYLQEFRLQGAENTK